MYTKINEEGLKEGLNSEIKFLFVIFFVPYCHPFKEYKPFKLF